MPPETLSIGSPLLWAGFTVFVLLMLALDLGVFHRKAHAVTVKEALVWSLVWIGLSCLFAGGLYVFAGPTPALEFSAGYLIEKALSVDNIFIFVLIFTGLGVPAAYQHRVLFWGVLGALVMRAIFIGLGAALLARFHWIMYLFGGLLVFTAIKLMVTEEGEFKPEDSRFYRFFRRVVPSTEGYEGQRFFVRRNAKWLATPLFFVLILVEVTDLLFAVDSIPAIFAVTQDPFIVYTSNIFAILGLRSLYFLLAGVVERFHYLKPALSVILGFVGVKMLLIDVYKIPIGLSLAVIAGVLVVAVVLSIRRERQVQAAGEGPA